ncbi:hypothetical protein F5J12DRAFT_702302, partial [Pisolithus orientalis]|uniref:uncharacterized protein n=1 Tax=Pisolithus orientalis TaxID=936130 RepID=UPI0022242A5C
PLCVDDLSTELVLSMFLALKHSSENAYMKTQRAIQKTFPDCELPTFHQMKCLLTNLSRVTSIVKDMCINSCTAFIGPLSALDTCPECSKPRYDQGKLQWSNGRTKHPHAIFHTIPITPQLQAL